MINPQWYVWAKMEALEQWDGKEGRTQEWVATAATGSESDLGVFKQFLNDWGISRTILTEGKRPLFNELVSVWRAKWQAARPGHPLAFVSVSAFARLAKAENWSTGGTPTSLASKAAFICNPLVYAPCDTFVRKALRQRGARFQNDDYPEYMKAFGRACEDLSPRLTQDAAKLAERSTRPLTPAVAAMRIADKYLMKEGGFQDR